MAVRFGELFYMEVSKEKRMEIKLIAADMDGTLLDDEKNIPAENLKALAECAARGIEIVPATGRTIIGLPEEVKKLPGVRYAITVNGAVVMDLKEEAVISNCRIGTGLAVKLMELARDSQDDIMYDAYVDGVGYTTKAFYSNFERYVSTAALVQLLRKTRTIVDDNIEYVRTCGKEVDKINMFFVDPEARERMRKILEEMPEIIVTSAISSNLEINAKGADKGGALLRLAEHLGIQREETMAFGDGGNDLTMMKAAGLGVAMENGYEYVKEAADYITVTNNEAGVAKAIRKFVLK